MLENPQERGLVAKVARDLNINYRTALRCLTERFENFTVSKSQLNNHLRNTMLITVKKPMFEPEVRNSVGNLQTRFEWFMEWKGSDLDFTKNCIFIDEAGFHINIRNNWARSKSGSSAIKRTATEISIEDPEVDDDPADNKPAPKGTTIAHFVKFMNQLLNVMDLDETFKGIYIVMDNVSIHKSKPMLRKIESKSYKVMYLPPYSP
ncbi:hypothetical protein G6F43_007951 [Rhizopus delemar]|nr:hypothetical protein G6F43_007951 [Rhizopus delemar]